MEDKEYFSYLYKIARDLNRAFSLPTALRQSLVSIIELFELDSGWIWLVQPDNESVYLAASHNLPHTLSQHPELLSGYCYCIKKYLADHMDKAANISEIKCTRLKDVAANSGELRFHATIPINVEGEKVGLINLMCPDIQQLDEKKLSVLNTISELIGMAIQRTRLEGYHSTNETGGEALKEALERIVLTRLSGMITGLKETLSVNLDPVQLQNQLHDTLKQMEGVQQQLHLILNESGVDVKEEELHKEFHYPASPLTNRELEVLTEVQKGYTNQQIGEKLYISERTVKFHITSILSKLYAKTRTEAVNTALKRGLLVR